MIGINYIEPISVSRVDLSVIYQNPKHLKRALSIYDSLGASTYNGSYEIFDLLNDINSAIVTCNFKDSILRPLNLGKQGYTETQIAKLIGISQQSVHEALAVACKKISHILTR